MDESLCNKLSLLFIKIKFKVQRYITYKVYHYILKSVEPKIFYPSLRHKIIHRLKIYFSSKAKF